MTNELDNYKEKIYHVQCFAPGWDYWMRWSGYRKGKSALDAIKDIRKHHGKQNWKFRIRINQETTPIHTPVKDERTW